MSALGAPQPTGLFKATRPKRFWKAEEPFFDMKASHWVEVALTIALIFVGISQFTVYNRQAKLMQNQLNISDRQLSFQKAVSRAWVRPKISLDRPILFTKWANDRFIEVVLAFDLKTLDRLPPLT